MYVDQILEELNDLVNDSGQVFLSDLTTKYNLPLDFIKEQVNAKMESALPIGC
jgi:hypothetical protein